MSGPIDLFLVAGQSNAVGFAPDNTLSPDTVAGVAYECTSNGTLKQLDDPVAGATYGSAWPAFANALTARTARAVCISGAAVGGSYLLPELTENPTWGESPDSVMFLTSVSRGLASVDALTTAGWTPTVRGVLWCQGEYDAAYGSADPDLAAKYEAALIDLYGRYKTALSTPDLRFYVFRTGGSAGAGYVAVRAAQDAACASTAGMEMVFTRATTFLERGLMADAWHYTQAGYNEMGAFGGMAVAEDLGFGRRRSGAVAGML